MSGTNKCWWCPATEGVRGWRDLDGQEVIVCAECWAGMAVEGPQIDRRAILTGLALIGALIVIQYLIFGDLHDPLYIYELSQQNGTL